MTDRNALERIATAWISLWNTPVDWHLFDELHAADFQDLAAVDRPATRDGFAAGLKLMTEAFPDLRTVIEGLVVDTARSSVAVRWSSVGTNRKEFLGIGPTGRSVSIRGIEIIEIADNKIVRRWGEWDISSHLGA